MMEGCFLILFVLLNQHVFTFSNEVCTSDQSLYGSSCYQFSQANASFGASKASCEALGMHLVYIESEAEQEFLEDRISGNETHWIGMSPLTWKDGSSLTYSNFREGWGINHWGHCFRMARYTCKWNDFRCSLATGRFICEKENISGCGADISRSSAEGQSCYYFSSSSSTANFSSSQSSCEDRGMHLVYINSADEQQFLADNVCGSNYAHRDFWIGLSGITWLDGSPLTYEKFSYDSNTFGQGAKCFVIEPEKSYQWIDYEYEDSLKHHYICERELACTVNGDCMNGGTCSGGNCDCSINAYSGDHCEIACTVDGDCMNGGTCSDGSCDCSGNSYSGDHCEIACTVDGDCMNGGICSDGRCDCSGIAYRGDHCEIGRKRFKNFRLLARDLAIFDAHVRSSITVSSLIECSQWCLDDVQCYCFTYIPQEGVCLLSGDCMRMTSAHVYRRSGANIYSTDQSCF